MILGMHRSGTSALTRFISELGISLPKDIMPASPNNNSLGFWESEEMVSINNAIRSMDMFWHSTSKMPLEKNNLSNAIFESVKNLSGRKKPAFKGCQHHECHDY